MADDRKKTYAESMNEWADEKRFLRKVRHRILHPDHERPLGVRLAGYAARLGVILLVVLLVLFFRNRAYFNGEGFRDAVKAEVDHYFGTKESEMQTFSWKGQLAVTNYSAKDGTFFRELIARRVSTDLSWREVLMGDEWTLQDTGISEVNVVLRPGAAAPSTTKDPDYIRNEGFLEASPNFDKIDFGRVTLHEFALQWGSDWSSEGSLTKATGSLRRENGDWTLGVQKGIISQNWLEGLVLDQEAEPPLEITVSEGQVIVRNGAFSLGDMGKGTIEGSITLGGEPLLDLNVHLGSANIEELVPDEFFEVLSGRGDFDLKVGGSTNRSEGVTFNGTYTVSDIKDESGLFTAGITRIRDFPIMRSLSILSARPELRRIPISAGSVDFATRRGVIDVSRMELRSSNVAKIRGAFRYETDTRELEKVVFEGLEGEMTLAPSPTLGFSGEIEIGLRWDLLEKYSGIRDTHFTKEDNYGWIKVPLKGPLLGLTSEQAKIIDFEMKQADLRSSP